MALTTFVIRSSALARFRIQALYGVGILWDGDESKSAAILWLAHLTLGYIVWIGWIYRANEKPYFLKRKYLWVLSLVQHFVWAVMLVRAEEPRMFILLYAHIIVVSIISGICIISDNEDVERKKQKLRQAIN